MTDNFDFFELTRVKYGRRILDDSGLIIKGYGEKALIVCGKGSMRKFGFLERLENSLHKCNVPFKLAEGISPDPSSDEIDKIVSENTSSQIEMVIGIGGGSVIDAAKAIAACLGDNISILKYLNESIIPSSKALPVIAIPSTAGTSSELSKGAIITNTSKKLKQGLRGENVFPKVAIIDPELTYSMPPVVTALTGFDVFCHAVETYISKKANPITELFSLEAIRTVSIVLPQLLKNLKDSDLRDEMVRVSILMGFNLANSSNCLPHRMQYPLGVHTSTSHQHGLAAIYPAWVSETFNSSKEKFATVLKILDDSVDENNLTPEHAEEIMTSFLRKINLDQKMTSMGVKKEDVAFLVNGVEGSLNVDPGYEGEETIFNIFENSL